VEKKPKPKTVELTDSDIEPVSESEGDILAVRQDTSFIGRDAHGRSIIDDPFARTIIDGRYEVVRSIGAGAMGSVFLVKHLRLGKLFALKMVNPKLAGVPEFASRFEREADVCSRLKHPNCISVTDFGQTSDGSLYLVMEYAEGEQLNEVVGKGKVEVLEAVEYVRQILLGLKHAHKEGLVHRDIKLENVIKCNQDDGSAVLKILDFGMAKYPVSDGKNTLLTDKGVIMGTPQYMAPEQIRGGAVDARTDLYAAGVTLFRLIAGRPVFEGKSHIYVFEAKLNRRAPTLFEVMGKVYPEELESLLAKALERHPSKRFANADEMLDALDQAEKAIIREEKRTRSLIVRLKKFVASKTGKIAALSGTGVLIIGVIAAVIGFSQSSATTSVSPKSAAVPQKNAAAFRLVPQKSKATDAPSAVASANNSAIQADGISTAAPVGKSGIPSEQTESVAPVDSDPTLIQAALLIDQKKCKQAEKILLKSPSPKSGRNQYLLGRCGVCRGQHAKALDYYKEAVALDERYRTDSGILEDAKQMALLPKTRATAVAFMSEIIGQSALPSLIQMAGHSPIREVRKLALAAAERSGALKLVDIAASLELDLNQAPSCKEKLRIAEQLAALGTSQARQVLIRAKDAEVRVNIFKTRYKNECIRKDLIRLLQEMKKK
jgi:serine/threonine protein kinase